MADRVRHLGNDWFREELGPVEGQYVQFVDEFGSANPRTNPTPCHDLYAFSPVEPIDELCVELAVAEPFPGFSATFGLLRWELGVCTPFGEEVVLPNMDTSASYCYTDLPAGNYTLYVYAWEITPSVPYTLTLESTAPLADLQMADDEYCLESPWCPD